MSEVWPSLELYMHGGVSFTPYKEQFQKLIGKDINYLEIYNASEGFFSAQSNDKDDMLLFLDHGIFFEFMPMSEVGKKNPETIGLENVELVKNYALIITTNGGLWRYQLGDTIQFTSLKPFRIKVSGRIKLSEAVFKISPLKSEILLILPSPVLIPHAIRQAEITVSSAPCLTYLPRKCVKEPSRSVCW